MTSKNKRKKNPPTQNTTLQNSSQQVHQIDSNTEEQLKNAQQRIDELDRKKRNLEDYLSERTKKIEELNTLWKKHEKSAKEAENERRKAENECISALKEQERLKRELDEEKRRLDVEITRYEALRLSLENDLEGWKAQEYTKYQAALSEELLKQRTEVEAQLQRLRQEAERQIQAKQKQAEQAREALEHEQATALAERRALVERDRAEAARMRHEADQILIQARQEAKSANTTYQHQLEQKALEARKAFEQEQAQKQAALGIAQAEVEAKRARAQVDAAQIQEAAQLEAARLKREAESVLQQARAEAAAAHETQAHMLRMEADRLASEARAQIEQEAALARKYADIDSEERQLQAWELQLQAEQARLDESRKALREEERRLGPAAIERLERINATLEARLEASREAHHQATLENEVLVARLHAAAGEDATERYLELERLRTEEAKLRAALEGRLSVAESERLKQEVARASELRTFNSDLRQRIQELERAQDQHEGVLRSARRDAEGAQREARRVTEEAANTQVALLQKHQNELNEYILLLDAQREENQQLRTQEALFEQGRRELAIMQTQLDAERVHNDEFKRKLAQYTEQARAASISQFGKLAEMDAQSPVTNLGKMSGVPALPDFVERIRLRIAEGVGESKTPLYYDSHTIRAFLGGLACSDLTLLQGPSGTGKTSLPLAVGEAIGADVVRVPVQAGWRDRNDLLGYYNAFTRTYHSTNFTEAVYRAGFEDYRDRPVFIILDECNLSQMEYYFADLLSELEDWRRSVPSVRLFENTIDGQKPQLLEDGRALRLPRNIRYFGTANQDESTYGIADKTYDRASVMILESRAQDFPASKSAQIKPIRWSGLTQRFQSAIELKGYEIQPIKSFIKELEPIYIEGFGFGLGNRFEERILHRFLPVYVNAGGQAGQGLDHLVRTRIIRRLDRLRDPSTRPHLEALRDLALGKHWPFKNDKPEMSLSALERIIARVGR